MRSLLLFLFTSAALLAQSVTTVSGVSLRNTQGSPVTGSLCIGSSVGAANATCQFVSNGTMSSFTVANGTYSLWLVENGVTIASTTGAAFSGSTILADSYFSSAYAVTVAGTPVYLSSMIAGLTCNGNAVVLPSSPTNYQQLKLANLSTTTGCSVSGNGNNIMYQAANVSPATLPAKYVAEVIFVQNYDYAGHNAWIVTHIGT